MDVKRQDAFRYAEKCLYEYKRNMACLEVLKEDLRVGQASTDVHAQNYQQPSSFTGEPSNPVQTRLMKLEKLEERIRILERYTQPVTRLIEDLTAPYVHEGSAKAEMYSIMELYYFGQNSISFILSELHMSRKGIYNKRSKLVKMALGYMGCFSN